MTPEQKIEDWPLEQFDFGAGPVPARRHPNGGGWVALTAHVDASAFVGNDARVFGDAHVYGRAQVCGAAQVYGEARVFGSGWILDNARVSGNAQIYGDAHVYGNAHVYGEASVFGDARVFGNARVYGEAQIYGDARVSEICTRTPIVLTGFPHTLTITDHHVRAGCKIFPPSEWLEHGAKIIEADEVGSDTAERWAAIIATLIAEHGCSDAAEMETDDDA